MNIINHCIMQQHEQRKFVKQFNSVIHDFNDETFGQLKRDILEMEPGLGDKEVEILRKASKY